MSGSVQPGSPRKPRARAVVDVEPEVEQTDERAMSASALAQSMGEEILRQAETRPYTTVLVATAAGYMLAVATPSWARNLVWTVGSRLVVSKLVASLA